MTGNSTAARYLKSVTEAQMREAVQQIVSLRGGRLFHVRRSDVAPELTDLLDWLIIDPRGGRVILAEAKSIKRELTIGQADLLATLEECTRFESFLVRAAEPREGEISYDTFLNYLNGAL